MFRCLFTFSFFFTCLFTSLFAYDDCTCFPCDEPRCCGEWTFGAAWLYWKTEETGLIYGANVTGAGTEPLDIESRILRPEFEYQSGFRLFTNYLTPDRQWLFSAEFSRVPTHATSSFDTTSMVSMNFATLFNVNFPILSAISNAMFSNVDATWDTHFNYLDLDVSKSFYCFNCLEILPYIGVRGLWFKQTFDLSGFAPDTLTFESSLNGKIYSIGLLGGLNTQWKFWRRLSLIGNVGGSVLYSKYCNNGTLSGFSFTDNEPFNIRYNDENFGGIPTFDLFIGLNYEYCCRCFTTDLYLGWEEHIVFNTNQFSLSGEDHLTLQGLTLGGSFTF